MVIIYILLGISLLLNAWCVRSVLYNTETLKIILEHVQFKPRDKE